MLPAPDARRDGDQEDGRKSHSVMECVDHLMRAFIGHFDDKSSLEYRVPAGYDLEAVDRSLTRLLPHIRYLRNTSLPVMRLPLNLLSNILLIAQTEDVKLRQHSGNIRTGFVAEASDHSGDRKVQFTRVCRHWRNVVLSSPSLPTDISTACVERPTTPSDNRQIKPSAGTIQAYLEPSNHLPLVAQMCVPREFWDWQSSELYEALMTRALRFKGVHTYNDDYDRIEWASLDLDAPRLKAPTAKLEDMLSLRNATLPAMCLPAEILSNIFLIAQAKDVDLRQSKAALIMEGERGLCGHIIMDACARPFDYSLKWIQLTHVCRHWREVAVNCPSLWTNISTTSTCVHATVKSHFLRTYLERSRQLPLIVQIHWNEDAWDLQRDEACKALIAHASRFKELHICTENYNHVKTMLLEIDAPHLQTFVARVSKPLTHGAPMSFVGTMASVEHMAILTRPCFLSDYAFGNLRQLHLSGEAPLSIDMLSAVLDANPFLEDLMLVRISRHEWDFISPPREPAKKHLWKNIRRLAFEDNNYNHGARPTHSIAPYVLSHIQLPSQHLSLAITQRGYNVTSINELVHHGSTPLLDITAIRIEPFDGRDQNVFRLVCSGPTVAWYVDRCSAGAGKIIFPGLRTLTVDFYSEPSWRHGNVDSSGSELYNWLKPQGIQEIILRLPRDPGYGAGYPALFLRSICQPAEDGTLPYASLESMHIHGADWKLPWKDLLAIFKTRRSMGLPIQHLYFYISENDSPGQEYDYSVRSTFNDWRSRFARDAELLSYVQRVEFRVVPKYPRMRLPPACTPNEHGKWQWFDWNEIGDVEGTLDEL